MSDDSIFPIDPGNISIRLDVEKKTVYVLSGSHGVALSPDVALLIGSGLVHAARILLGEEAPPPQETRH